MFAVFWLFGEEALGRLSLFEMTNMVMFVAKPLVKQTGLWQLKVHCF